MRKYCPKCGTKLIWVSKNEYYCITCKIKFKYDWKNGKFEVE